MLRFSSVAVAACALCALALGSARPAEAANPAVLPVTMTETLWSPSWPAWREIQAFRAI
jgi:hypothetical protein